MSKSSKSQWKCKPHTGWRSLKAATIIRNNARECYTYSWYEGKKRRGLRLGSLKELLTREDQERAATRAWEGMESNRVTVRMVHDQYWKSGRAPERIGTRHNYKTYMKHVLAKWEDNLMIDLEADPVEQWIKTLKNKRGQPFSPESCKHVRNVLSQLWNYAIFKKLVPWAGGDTKTWMSHVQLPKNAKGKQGGPREKAHSFSQQEFALWLCLLPDQYRLIAVIASSLCLRIGECLGYKWSDIDWELALITIKRQYTMRVITDSLKTEESEATMPLHPKLVNMLKEWQARSFYNGQDDWLFTYKGGKPLSYEAVLRQFKMAARKLGIKGKISTHSMRHSCISWMDDNGENIETQREGARHSTTKQTRDYGKRKRSQAVINALFKVAEQVTAPLTETPKVLN
jgi:integrase